MTPLKLFKGYTFLIDIFNRLKNWQRKPFYIAILRNQKGENIAICIDSKVI